MKYGIISDIHSDIKSLNKVLEKLRKIGIEQTFCCGDMVGYGNFPEAVVELIIENNIKCVSGNHEKALFNEDDYLDMNEKAQEAINENIDYLSVEQLKYLKQLPDYLVHKNMRFVHGLPPNSYSQYLNYLRSSDLRKVFNTFSEQIAFCGHTHRTMFIEYDGRGLFVESEIELEKEYSIEANNQYIVNVGSVSLPRNTKKQTTHFVMFDSDSNKLMFYAF